MDPDGREAAVIGGILFAGGIIALGGTLHYMTTNEFQDSCKGLGDAIQYGFDYAYEEIKSWFSSDYSKAEDGKDKNVGVLQNSLLGGGKITSVSPSPMPHGDDDDHIIGEKGTRVDSKTTWKNGKTERIDVENPNPGGRPGQIHYHDAQNNKYMYDIKNKSFYDAKTGQPAPKSVQNLLNNKDFVKGINSALKVLGE